MSNHGENPKGPPVLTNVADTESARVIPILRDVVASAPRTLTEDEIAALQTELTTLTRDVAEQLVGSALREMEAALYEQLDGRLREELPDLIAKVLQQHLDTKN